MKCIKCGTETGFEAGSRPGRSESCSNCGQDIRCCLFCEFYDKTAQWECREHISQAVLEKSRGNFCDDFRMGSNSSAGNTQKETQLSAAEKLFKK